MNCVVFNEGSQLAGTVGAAGRGAEIDILRSVELQLYDRHIRWLFTVEQTKRADANLYQVLNFTI